MTTPLEHCLEESKQSADQNQARLGKLILEGQERNTRGMQSALEESRQSATENKARLRKAIKDGRRRQERRDAGNYTVLEKIAQRLGRG